MPAAKLLTAVRSLSKKERRAVGALIVAISLFALFSPFDDDQNSSFPGRRFLFSDHDSNPKPRTKRLAIIRPFGTRDGQALLDSFNLWDTRWPCVADADAEYDVDLVLSYSRRLDDETEDGKVAAGIVDEIKNKLMGVDGGGVGGGWSQCFTGLRLIEADIDPTKDVYERGPTGTPERIDWVAGPNAHFRKNMVELMRMPDAVDNGVPVYELALIMEADNQPQRTGWLNEILAEINQRAPFAILGSKYRGNSWDGIKDIMPKSLVDHVNGNAVYNLTHPLLKKVVNELEHEAGTEYEAVPYDYRISQMAHEGKYGTPPEFPFPWMVRSRNDNGKSITSPISLRGKKKKFERWWRPYRKKDDPIKESGLISNFAQTNYLAAHLSGNEALVHGTNVHLPLNPYTHQISLVVSAWDDRRQHHSLLTELEKSNHFFKEVVVIENSHDSVTMKALEDLDSSRTPIPKTSIPVRVVERDVGADVTDICTAPVSTEWFFHTNAYHRFVGDADLMFTQENPISRPLVPYTPADSMHCEHYPGCKETLRIAREIYPDLDKVFLDMDVLYHTASRDAFCKFWRGMYGHNGEALEEREGGRSLARENGVPLAPTATAYVAYLYRIGLAENIYSFQNVLKHGTSPRFLKVTEEREEVAVEKETAEVFPDFHRALPTCAKEGQPAIRCGYKRKGGLSVTVYNACCPGFDCDPATDGFCMEDECAEKGGLAEECGASPDDPAAVDLCCTPDYECKDWPGGGDVCVPKCADIGKPAISCGGSGTVREECCNTGAGLTCDEVSGKCIDDGCAIANQVARECQANPDPGASVTGMKLTCCDGWVCKEDDSGQCMWPDPQS